MRQYRCLKHLEIRSRDAYHRVVEKSNSASAISPISSRITTRTSQSCVSPERDTPRNPGPFRYAVNLPWRAQLCLSDKSFYLSFSPFPAPRQGASRSVAAGSPAENALSRSHPSTLIENAGRQQAFPASLKTVFFLAPGARDCYIPARGSVTFTRYRLGV
jgi:hypothetical protein